MASPLILLSLLLLCAPFAFAQNRGCNLYLGSSTCSANATMTRRINSTVACTSLPDAGDLSSSFKMWINSTNFYMSMALFGFDPNVTDDSCLTTASATFIYWALPQCQYWKFSNWFSFSWQCDASIGATAPTTSVNQSLSMQSNESCASPPSYVMGGSGFQCMKMMSALVPNGQAVFKWTCSGPTLSIGAAKSKWGCDATNTTLYGFTNGCLPANNTLAFRSTTCASSAALPAYGFGLALLILLAAVLLL